MLLTNLPRHHSAEVRLYLRTLEGDYPLAQIGPHDVIFEKEVELPPCDAEIVMHIDGEVQIWPVRLVDGVSTSNRRGDTVPR